LSLFAFATWKREEIKEVIRKIEEPLEEQGGFISMENKTEKAARQLKNLLGEK
jgi:hypothetical protein